MKFLKAIFLFFLPLVLSAQNYYGGSPALFDDFSYTNTQFPIEGDSSGSLFGKNIWKTDTGEISSRAWHRFNWGDGDVFGEDVIMRPSGEGIEIGVKKGFKSTGTPPIFCSEFLSKGGTYVSCIRFDTLLLHLGAIQAFWLLSPDHYRFSIGNEIVKYFSEVDFEWNNSFSGFGKNRMHVANLAGNSTKRGNISIGTEMSFFKTDGNGNFSHLSNSSLSENVLAKKWFYYVISIDTAKQTTSFYAESADAEEIIYGGSAAQSGKILPVVHTQHFSAK